MAQKFSDAARGYLASGITDVATSLTIASGGSLYPVANLGASAVGPLLALDWFKAVLQDSSGIEIVYVRTHTSGSNSFTDVLRGQEGTTARAFSAGAVFGVRITAADMASLDYGAARFSGISLTGDLTFNGPARRIIGDFTNSTIASRAMFQTSTVNGNTYIGILPNGTSTNAQLHIFGTSDPANSPYATLTVNSGQVRLQSVATGTGTLLPMAFLMSSTEVFRLSTGNNFLIGNTVDDGVNKLQVTGSAAVSGNLTFTGTGNRITGDFSNATVPSRTLLQSSTANGNTLVGAIPNGTATVSRFGVYNATDPANASTLSFGITSTAAEIVSTLNGTGAALPLNFFVNGAQQLGIATTGVATFAQNPILNSGTINQVQFLNASKVLSGSANLTFDGTTLTAAGLAGPHNGTVGATTASTGAFTTLSASSTVTLSGGTANGVPYLNGSKQLVSGTALTFDGTNLATTGRFSSSGQGIPTIYANQTYSSAGDSAAAIRLNLNNGAGGGYLEGYSGDTWYSHNAEFINGSNWLARQTTSSRYQQSGAVHSWFSDSGLTIGSAFTPTELMRLNSIGLGIGTSSPAYKLDINTPTVPATDTYSSLQLQSSNYGYVLSGGIKQGAGGVLKFSLNQAGTLTEMARLDTPGNLLLTSGDTSNPGSAKLHVKTASGEVARFSTPNGQTGYIAIGRPDVTTEGALLGYNSNNGEFSIASVASSHAIVFRQGGIAGTERARVTTTELSLTGLQGIKFQAAQSASSDANTLDDYEEGTFTPGILFGGAAVGMSFLVQSGQYTKIGRLVYVRMIFRFSSKGSSTGNAQIINLPFTATSMAGGFSGQSLTLSGHNGFSSITAPISMQTNEDSTNVNLVQGFGAVTSLTNANFDGTSSQYFSITGCYVAA